MTTTRTRQGVGYARGDEDVFRALEERNRELEALVAQREEEGGRIADALDAARKRLTVLESSHSDGVPRRANLLLVALCLVVGARMGAFGYLNEGNARDSLGHLALTLFGTASIVLLLDRWSRSLVRSCGLFEAILKGLIVLPGLGAVALLFSEGRLLQGVMAPPVSGPFAMTWLWSFGCLVLLMLLALSPFCSWLASNATAFFHNPFLCVREWFR